MSHRSNIPELLAPAKNLERLKTAIRYGADAVYVGGQRYGLRARADNLTDEELEQAVHFAHENDACVYLTMNAFLHDEDFAGFEEYCAFLEHIGLDAVIVSDLGVLRRVQQCSNLSIHLSTQASCLNSYGAKLWKRLGVERLIVGRELSIAEGGHIAQEAGVDVEMFVHGAMCMAFSGHCTISNFTAGRDSNRGGCSQSCRFAYQMNPEPTPETTKASFYRAQADSASTAPFMSSMDMAGIAQIPLFFQHGICSLKIEGRMKSSLYVATTCRVYRRLIDAYASGAWSEALVEEARQELLSVPHRTYFSGSLNTPAGPDSVFEQSHGNNTGTHALLGTVLDVDASRLTIQLHKPLKLGDTLEFLTFTDEPLTHTVDSLLTVLGQSKQAMRQDSVVCLPTTEQLSRVQTDNVVRIVSV
ncbi:MAG: U32 family peptidase [Deltaproteobacteria bacterium]|nr:MAG: U32 family peptidase [Deltaproteobacteria bacterium]